MTSHSIVIQNEYDQKLRDKAFHHLRKSQDIVDIKLLFKCYRYEIAIG